MTIEALNFSDILACALAASAAYDDDEHIRARYGSSTAIASLPNGVKVFAARNPAWGFQWLSVRGTDDWLNVREDVDYIKAADTRLGVYLHSGFHADASAVYEQMRGQLDKAVEVRVTGHSLGGAVAAILQAWLRADGYRVDTTVTFGQPKITNQDGVIKLRGEPLLRVVNDEDVVPMVPPLTLLSALHGPYRHFGQELQLGPAAPKYKLYNEHDAETPDATGFWCNLCHERPSDHHIALYVAKLQAFCSALSDEHHPVAAARAALPTVCSICDSTVQL